MGACGEAASRPLHLASLHKQIGVVSQETQLFNATIQENIAYGAPPHTDAELAEATRAACASEFIASFEDGLLTRVGERGQRLSGGQKQRIAIARCLLRKPKLLLLDEATSALDAESEHVVQEAIDRLMKNRTTVVVAHRLASVVDADTILVMKDGSLVERGAHADLVSVPGGVYAAMWAQQASSTNATQWLPQRPPDAWAGMPDYRALLPDGAIQGELLGASSNDAAPRRSSSTAARPGQAGDAPLDPGRLADGSIQGALLGAEPEVVGETIEDEMETEALRAAQGWLW